MINEEGVASVTKIIEAIEKKLQDEHKLTFLGITEIDEFGVTFNVEHYHCGCCTSEIQSNWHSWGQLSEGA